MEILGVEFRSFGYRDGVLIVEWRILGLLRCWGEGSIQGWGIWGKCQLEGFFGVGGRQVFFDGQVDSLVWVLGWRGRGYQLDISYCYMLGGFLGMFIEMMGVGRVQGRMILRNRILVGRFGRGLSDWFVIVRFCWVRIQEVVFGVKSLLIVQFFWFSQFRFYQQWQSGQVLDINLGWTIQLFLWRLSVFLK